MGGGILPHVKGSREFLVELREVEEVQAAHRAGQHVWERIDPANARVVGLWLRGTRNNVTGSKVFLSLRHVGLGGSAGGVLENPHRFSGGLRQGGDLGVKYRYPSGPRV